MDWAQIVAVALVVALLLVIAGRRPRNRYRAVADIAAEIVPAGPVDVASFDGFTINVVGEAEYQRTLERLAGGRERWSANQRCVAILSREPRNRQDANAIRVEIEGQLVGYVDHIDALVLQPYMVEMERRGSVVALDGMIVGGWDRGGGDRGHYGVALAPMRVDRAR